MRDVEESNDAGSVRDVLSLAWPATTSFVLHNAYRVNDQYWVQHLGPEATAAIGASTFALIMGFAAYFLAAGGALSLVARAVGAGDVDRRDETIRHSLLLACAVAALLTVLVLPNADVLARLLGLSGETAELAATYLHTLGYGLLPMALLPVVDGAFVAMGNTVVPLCMQVVAVTTNFVLNPVLIYGYGIEGFDGVGMEGAAWATIASRSLGVGLGLAILVLSVRVRIVPRGAPSLHLLGSIIHIGVPTSLSVATYAGVYWLLLSSVVAKLGSAVVAGGLGVGFNVFEGVSFPFFLGVGVACSSLVGRGLGAERADRVDAAIRSSRRIAAVAGASFATAFALLAPVVAPLFTGDSDVLLNAVLYVRVLAFSQFFVSAEVVNERALLGAGRTRSIFAVSVPGNLLRIPLAWLLALRLDLGAAGVWWAINLTTLGKALVLYGIVQRFRGRLHEEM